MSFNDNEKGWFVYHGNALGFGGHLKRPECACLGTHAMAIVPPSGGESYSIVKNFNYKGIVSFDEASAYATGNESRDARNMLATVTIKNFNFLGYIHADLIVARISSVHEKKRQKFGEVSEARLSLQGSRVDGLTVGGTSHDVRLDTSRFDKCETFDDVANEFPDGSQKYMGDQSPSIVRGSLAGAADAVMDEDAGDVFGRIYLAEFIAQRGHVRLNMLRFELGSPVEGGATVASGEGNGTEMPPRP